MWVQGNIIRWGQGQTNPFAAARVARWRYGLLSEYFDNLTIYYY